MRRNAIAATVTLAMVAVLTARIIGTLTPSAEAQSSPPSAPGIPVAAGTGATVPVFLNAIGGVQAHEMGTVKSGGDLQIVTLAFTEGQAVKAADQLIRVDPRPFLGALDQALAHEKDLAAGFRGNRR
jgi:multidrug efflux system membrane fusion protein